MTHVTRTRIIILTAATGVALFFLHILGVLSNTETWIMRNLSSREVRIASAGRSFRQMLTAPFRVIDLIDENDQLKEERNELLSEMARLHKMGEENEELRDLLDFAKKEGKTPVTAHVLAQLPESGRHTILIDRGSDHGLQLEMPVIINNGILIGKVFKLDRVTAIVLLLTDTRSHVGAVIHNSNRTLGVVQGKRGLSLEMRLIPQNEDIAEGDLAVTSGIEPLIPKGLVIGSIQSIQTEERNPFKRATVVSPAAFDRLEIVALLFP